MEQEQRNIEDIAKQGLPGFYMNSHGYYGIVLGGVYICAFINSDTNEYDVTVDAPDNVGDFADNIEWQSFETPEHAIDCLRRMVRAYCPPISRQCR